MVEEQSLTDAELDAALTEAFADEPSPDFAARVRERLAGERIAGSRPSGFVAVTVTLATAAIVSTAVMLERRPADERLPVRVAAASARDNAIHPRDAPVVAAPAATQREHKAASHSATSRLPRRTPELAHEEPSDVLIPSAEQQALRRLLERPPTAVLRFAPSVETTVAAIDIPPLTIDPLLPEVEEGGHQ
jgi:hypothetical protein